MKINLSKGAVIGYLIIFGTAGLAAVLDAAGLPDIAEFVRKHLSVLQHLDYSQLAALVLALIGINQAQPLLERKK